MEAGGGRELCTSSQGREHPLSRIPSVQPRAQAKSLAQAILGTGCVPNEEAGHNPHPHHAPIQLGHGPRGIPRDPKELVQKAWGISGAHILVYIYIYVGGAGCELKTGNLPRQKLPTLEVSGRFWGAAPGCEGIMPTGNLQHSIISWLKISSLLSFAQKWPKIGPYSPLKVLLRPTGGQGKHHQDHRGEGGNHPQDHRGEVCKGRGNNHQDHRGGGGEPPPGPQG